MTSLTCQSSISRYFEKYQTKIAEKIFLTPSNSPIEMKNSHACDKDIWGRPKKHQWKNEDKYCCCKTERVRNYKQEVENATKGVKNHRVTARKQARENKFIFLIAFFLIEAPAFYHVIYSMGNFSSHCHSFISLFLPPTSLSFSPNNVCVYALEN